MCCRKLTINIFMDAICFSISFLGNDFILSQNLKLMVQCSRLIIVTVVRVTFPQAIWMIYHSFIHLIFIEYLTYTKVLSLTQGSWW